MSDENKGLRDETTYLLRAILALAGAGRLIWP